MTLLTKRRLRAIEGALSAMLAGFEGEGDWPDDVSAADMESAYSWVVGELQRRGEQA